MNLEALSRGDIVRVIWLDITENPTGDLGKSALTKRYSLGHFWEVKQSEGVECLVTTTTMEDDPSQSGWCIYPIGCVVEVEVIKRKRVGRKAKRDGSAGTV